MARKPNYAIERNNRAKAKAAKREAKRQAKLAGRSRKTNAEALDDGTRQPTELHEDEAVNGLDPDAATERS